MKKTLVITIHLNKIYKQLIKYFTVFCQTSYMRFAYLYIFFIPKLNISKNTTMF